MPNVKYIDTDPIIIPVLGVHVTTGQVVEVPEEFAEQFASDPRFESSQRKTADVSPDPVAAQTFTAPVSVVAAAAPDEIHN